jgi:hypothetical protein
MRATQINAMFGDNSSGKWPIAQMI